MIPFISRIALMQFAWRWTSAPFSALLRDSEIGGNCRVTVNRETGHGGMRRYA